MNDFTEKIALIKMAYRIPEGKHGILQSIYN